jgi:hypothetical protein
VTATVGLAAHEFRCSFYLGRGICLDRIQIIKFSIIARDHKNLDYIGFNSWIIWIPKLYDFNNMLLVLESYMPFLDDYRVTPSVPNY